MLSSCWCRYFSVKVGVGADAEGDRRREAPALAARERAAVLVVALAHHIDAHRAVSPST